MKALIAITGASSGIGEAAAKLFSESGHPLLLMARRVEKLKALSLPNCVCSKVDVTKAGEIRSALDTAEEKFGPVDCLVNNAGTMFLGRPWEQELTQWQAMVDTNIMGVMNGTHEALKGMVERRTGTIINVSSLAGRKTFPKHSVYCATNFAVHAFSETVRGEVSKFNVRLITIAPGAL